MYNYINYFWHAKAKGREKRSGEESSKKMPSLKIYKIIN